MADGDAIKQALSNPINWLAGVVFGLGGLWLGSGFDITGWPTGLLSLIVGIAGSAIVTQEAGFHLFQPDGSEAQGSRAFNETQMSQARNQWLDVAAAMERYDLDGAEKAGIEKLPVNKPEELALRGKYRFRRYLQKQTLAGGKINPRDPAMTEAIADLVKANTADASLELVEIYLCTRELHLAEKIAEEGQAKFDDHRFKTALTRVRLEQDNPPKKPIPGGAQEKPRVPYDQPEAEKSRWQFPVTQTMLQEGADDRAGALKRAPSTEMALPQLLDQESHVSNSISQCMLPLTKRDSKTPSRA